MPAAIWPFSERALSVNEANETQTAATVERTIKTCFIAPVPPKSSPARDDHPFSHQNTGSLYSSLTRYSPESIIGYSASATSSELMAPLLFALPLATPLCSLQRALIAVSIVPLVPRLCVRVIRHERPERPADRHTGRRHSSSASVASASSATRS